VCFFDCFILLFDCLLFFLLAIGHSYSSVVKIWEGQSASLSCVCDVSLLLLFHVTVWSGERRMFPSGGFLRFNLNNLNRYKGLPKISVFLAAADRRENRSS